MRFYLKIKLEGNSCKLNNLISDRGNFGVVFKASWRQAECVVKKLEFTDTKTILKDFEREANAMRSEII